MKDVAEPPFLQPSPVLLDALSAEQRGAINHVVRGVSTSCPHRFDTRFVPTANPDRDSIIVTRNAPLISAVSRTRPGEYRIWGGSFIGGSGSSEVTADEAAEYLRWSPHWANLMRTTLEIGGRDVHRALGSYEKHVWLGSGGIAQWRNSDGGDQRERDSPRGSLGANPGQSVVMPSRSSATADDTDN